MKHRVILAAAFCMFTAYVKAALAPLYIPARSYNASGYQELLDRLGVPTESDGCWFGVLHVVPEYRRTFNGSDVVGRMLLGDQFRTSCSDSNENDDHITINIAGSRVENRNPSAWLADYFGLSPNYESCLRLEPYRDAFLARATFYLSYHGCLTDYFMYLYAPLVNARTSLDVCEHKWQEGTLGYDEGYFTPSAVPTDDLFSSFLQYAGGFSALNLPNSVRFETLQCGRWIDPCNRLSQTGLADLKLQFGANCFSCSLLTVQLFGLLGAPTGNSPDGQFFFEPIIGNGGHAEAGGGAYMYGGSWESLSIHVYGYVTHLFENTQCRIFNLKNKSTSVYMLAERISLPVSDDLWSNEQPGNVANSTQPNAQFKKVYTPVANLTCIPVSVSVKLQGEFDALIHYQTDVFAFDLGYSFWARACETICPADDCTHTLDMINQWALKGDSYLFGFVESTNEGVALSATQSNALITMGTNNFIGPDPSQGGTGGLAPNRNPGVDNAQFARTGPDINAESILNLTGPMGQQTKTSNPAIPLSAQDVDICPSSAAQSHTIFAQGSYLLAHDCGWRIYTAVGGKVEFSDFSNIVRQNLWGCNLRSNNKGCVKLGYSELGVWLRVGIGFN